VLPGRDSDRGYSRGLDYLRGDHRFDRRAVEALADRLPAITIYAAFYELFGLSVFARTMKLTRP
jgi:hypothetical protein